MRWCTKIEKYEVWVQVVEEVKVCLALRCLSRCQRGHFWGEIVTHQAGHSLRHSKITELGVPWTTIKTSIGQISFLNLKFSRGSIWTIWSHIGLDQIESILKSVCPFLVSSCCGQVFLLQKYFRRKESILQARFSPLEKCLTDFSWAHPLPGKHLASLPRDRADSRRAICVASWDAVWWGRRKSFLLNLMWQHTRTIGA